MKYLFVFLLVGFSVNCFGQLDIQESTKENRKENSTKVGKVLNMRCTKLHSTYNFNFNDIRNNNNSAIKQFPRRQFYINGDADFNQLYNYIVKSIDNKTKKELKIKLNNGNILRLNIRKKSVQFVLFDGSTSGISYYYTKNQIKKLFGKE